MNDITGFELLPVLVIGLGYLLVLFPASFLIKTLLKPWIDQIRNTSSGSLVNAGAMIGYLERLLILTFVLMNEFTAVGFILALKAAYLFQGHRRSYPGGIHADGNVFEPGHHPGCGSGRQIPGWPALEKWVSVKI